MAWEMTTMRRERLTAGEAAKVQAPLWVLVVSGSATLETAHDVLTVRAGDAVLLDERTAFRLLAAAAAVLVHADLRLIAPSPPLPSPFVVRGFAAQHPGVAALVRGCPAGPDSSALFQESYTGLLGAAIASSWQATATAGSDDVEAGDPMVQDVVSALASRPAEPWTLDRMAALVHLSRSGLTERFRRSTGRSAMQVLRDVRMLEARRLLRDKELPITSVAFAVGYGSVAAFSRAFAAHHDDVPPQEWRRDQARGTRSNAQPTPAAAAAIAPTASVAPMPTPSRTSPPATDPPVIAS